MIFCLSHGMAIFDGNFHPMGVVASLAMLYYLEAHMKKKFLKLAKKQAKHSPKTIGRIVWYYSYDFSNSHQGRVGGYEFSVKLTCSLKGKVIH